MGETPLNDSSSFSASAESSSVPSSKPFAFRAAKLTLWSPFAAIFVMVVFANIVETAGGSEAVSAIGIASLTGLISLGGIVLGVVALRESAVVGRKGILVRTLVGLVLNVPLLILAILLVGMQIYISKELTEQRAIDLAGSARVKEQIMLADEAQKAFLARLYDIQTNYSNVASALLNPPVLNMAEVRSLEDLRAREAMTRKFMAVAREMLNFFRNGPEIFRQELMKKNLSHNYQERRIQDFFKPMEGIKTNIVILRETEVHRGEAILRVITLLEDDWGEWEYELDKHRVLFHGTNLLVQYQHALKDVENQDAEATRLSVKLKELVKTNL